MKTALMSGASLRMRGLMLALLCAVATALPAAAQDGAAAPAEAAPTAEVAAPAADANPEGGAPDAALLAARDAAAVAQQVEAPPAAEPAPTYADPRLNRSGTVRDEYRNSGAPVRR